MKIKLKLFIEFLTFVTIVTVFGIYMIIESDNIRLIEHEIEEGRQISVSALDFNVENFHTQLEILEYTFAPNQDRLDAFESHRYTLNELLVKWQDIVLHEAESVGEPYHVLYGAAVDDMNMVTSNLKLVENDWEDLLIAVGEYRIALDEGASDAEIKLLNSIAIEKMNANEALFDELQFNKLVDLFVTNQVSRIGDLQVERDRLVSAYTNSLYVLIISIVMFGLVFGYLISRSILMPIKKLKVGSDDLAKGIHSKIEVSGHDELTDLTQSFNYMATNVVESKVSTVKALESLQKQKDKLDKVNKQLLKQNKLVTIQSQETFQRFVLQNQLSTSNAELASEKKFRTEKDEFAAMVSHELKTPILPIMLHCEMLKDPLMLGDLTREQLESVTQIELMAKRLDTLTKDILDAQKLDMNQMKFKKTKFKVSKFFKDVIQSHQVLLEEKSILLTSSSNNLEIYTDRERLFQVFTNLIQNASVYVKKNTGKITISAKSENGNIIFSVKDNGIGIQPDKISNLFRKFYQIDTSLKRKHDNGTGLGLVICKGIVSGLGGDIKVKSELRKGSTFFFSIPMKEYFDYITGVRNPLLMTNMTMKNSEMIPEKEMIEVEQN